MESLETLIAQLNALLRQDDRSEEFYEKVRQILTQMQQIVNRPK